MADAGQRMRTLGATTHGTLTRARLRSSTPATWRHGIRRCLPDGHEVDTGGHGWTRADTGVDTDGHEWTRVDTQRLSSSALVAQL